MRFLIVLSFTMFAGFSSFAKIEKKKLDLTTISKPSPAPKVDAEPTLNEPKAAAEPVPAAATTTDGYSEIDLKQFEDVNKPIKTNSMATIKCRSNSGIRYSPTDEGFESCLKQNEIDKVRASKNKADQNNLSSDHTPGQSIDFTFGESN